MTIGVKKIGLERTLGDQIYLPAVFEGLLTSARHFFRNTFGKDYGDIETVRYGEPEVDIKTYYPARYRGVHRLMHREDGSVRCVACMCCSTVCPAGCIRIVAEEREDSHEKAPASFVIDELKCIYCGLCVEACPCDAIRMDTKQHMTPVEAREDARLGKADLLERGSRSVAVQGGGDPAYRLEDLPDDPRFNERTHSR
jgi:NADH-quinone oxidoreductase subunit I